jgi:hypothetical protein
VGVDVKWTWEPARFAHLFYLAHAGLEGAALAAADVDSWIEQNPPGYGPHWDNGLEAALRALAWIYADAILSKRGAESWLRVRSAMLRSLGLHGAFIEAHLTQEGYNHRVADALGLLALGHSYPSQPRARRWAGVGSAILHEEAERQVRGDGTHVEQAPAYARFVADMFLVAALILGSQGSKLLHTSTRMLDQLGKLAGSDGVLPRVGDDDGATVLWPVPADQRLVVSEALALAINGKVNAHLPRRALANAKRVVGGLLGEDATAHLACGPRKLHPGLHLWPDAGWARIVNGPNSVYFKAGKMGPKNAAHGHADLLMIEVQRPGWPSLVDPGTPGYNGDPDRREASTGTPAHATISIDGLSQAKRRGTFAWVEPASAVIRSQPATSGKVAARGRLVWPCGLAEHERLVTVGENTIDVEDTVVARGAHDASLCLTFAGRCAWDGNMLRDEESGDAVMLISEGWQTVSAEPAKVSVGYGAPAPATRLTFSSAFHDQLEVRIHLACPPRGQ